MKLYIRASLSKEEQFQIIYETNPAPEEIYTWIRSVDDIQTFQEAFENNRDGYSEGFTEDYTAEDMLAAIRTGKITVYSSYPIENGKFVTPSYMEAKSYGGSYGVYTATVDLDDIAWIDVDQGQVATNKKINYKKIK